MTLSPPRERPWNIRWTGCSMILSPGSMRWGSAQRALAQGIAAEFTSEGHAIGEVVTFNSPGISSSAATYPGLETYAGDFNPALSAGAMHYVVNGDRASMAGESFITGQYVVAS